MHVFATAELAIGQILVAVHLLEADAALLALF